MLSQAAAVTKTTRRSLIDIVGEALYRARMTDKGPVNLTIPQALNLAATAQRDGQGEKARAIYNQVLASDPDNGDALHLMGLLELDGGHPGKAEPHLRKAFENFPDVPAFRSSFGRVLHDLGHIAEGIGHAAAALAAAPDNVGIREVANRLLRVEPSVDMLRLYPALEPLQVKPARPEVDALVIGVATGYAAAALRPFVRSLREHYQGAVHLFVDETPEIIALLNDYRIDWSLMTAGDTHPVIHRFALYRDFIGDLAGAPRILLTDVSDVIFQGDPFSISAQAPLVGVLEDASMTIGSCPWNSDWVRTHFGTKMLNRLADRRISCIGTILGDRAGLLDYLTQFCLLAGSLPVNGIYGLDTAIHNVLIHHRTITGAAVLENGWPIATVQHMPESSIDVADEKIVLGDGRCPLIVHQYNRRARMIDMVNRRYAGY
jgi:hypothetical protein